MRQFYIILVLALGLWIDLSGQAPTSFQRGIASDQFGASVAISSNGDVLFVGCPGYDDTGNSNKGGGFAYHRSGGTWGASELVFPGSGPNSNTGISVAINGAGDEVLLGAPNGGNNKGTAYVCTSSLVGSVWTWTCTELIPSSSPSLSNGDNYGASVAISPDGLYIAIGAPNRDNSYTNDGSVFIFKKTGGTWNYLSEIQNPSGANNEYFGEDIALDYDGNVLAVGVPGDGTGGRAYTYSRDNMDMWSSLANFTPSSVTLSAGSNFGSSVDIDFSGDNLIVGAPNYNPGSSLNQGAAFTFSKNGTQKGGTILKTAGAANDLFGTSVSIDGSGNKILIGAPGSSSNGSVHSFLYTMNWGSSSNIPGPEPSSANVAFGKSVSLGKSSQYGAVGDPDIDLTGNPTTLDGKAYVYLPAALPVTWLTFRGALTEDGDANLFWSTASEANNEGFDIQRSLNGRQWETIAFVPGAGTTSEVQQYTYTDLSLSTLHAPLIYYRLMQKDYDGSTDYSPVRVLELNGERGGIRVFPNPASEMVTIAFAEPTPSRGSVKLLTQNNRLILEQAIAPQTTEYQLRVAPLPSGTYILQVKVGNQEWTKRLVVE